MRTRTSVTHNIRPGDVNSDCVSGRCERIGVTVHLGRAVLKQRVVRPLFSQAPGVGSICGVMASAASMR